MAASLKIWHIKSEHQPEMTQYRLEACIAIPKARVYSQSPYIAGLRFFMNCPQSLGRNQP